MARKDIKNRKEIKVGAPALNLFTSILVGLIFAGVFCAGVYVLAANPWPYTPPAPTDPGCSPTDPTCTVKPPLTDSFSSDFSGTGNFTTTSTIQGGVLKVGSVYTFPTADGTTGQVLKTNGTGTLSWQTVASVDVSGLVPYTGANTDVNLGTHALTTSGSIGAGAITGTSFVIGANTLSSFANLGSLAGLSIAQGDLLYGSGTSTLSNLAKSGTANQYLKNSGTSNNPAWATIAYGDISGTPSLTGYVPFTGANADVNLGTQNLTTTGTVQAGTISALNINGTIIATGTVFSTNGVAFDFNNDLVPSPIPSGIPTGGLYIVTFTSGTLSGQSYTIVNAGNNNSWNNKDLFALPAGSPSPSAGDTFNVLQVPTVNSNLVVNGSANIPGGQSYNIGGAVALLGIPAYNSFFIAGAGNATQYGSYNYGFGQNALDALVNGSYNNAMGYNAGTDITSGSGNTLIGNESGQRITTEGYNTYIGYNAGRYATGARNTRIGYIAGGHQTGIVGSGNVQIGYYSGKYETGSDTFYINNQDRTNLAGDKAKSLIYGQFDATAANQTLQINGRLGILTAPTADVTLPAGTTAAGTAPLQFTSGTSLTTPVAGAMEYTTDDLFFTIGTGTARKRLLMADAVGGLTSTRIPYATTNGRLTDDASLTYSSTTGLSTTQQITSTLANGTAPFAVTSTTQVANLNAATAGTATNATNTAITDDVATAATMYPTWVTATTGNLPEKTSSTKLTFNPSTGLLSTTALTATGTGTFGGISLAAGADRTIGVATAGSGNGNNLSVSAGNGSCFAAGTQITMSDGILRSIEDVQIGDTVEAYNTETKEIVNSPVTQTFQHTPAQMTGDYYLDIKTEQGRELKVTINHPIYFNGDWVEAGKLVVGDKLTDQNGNQDTVISIKKIYQRIPTYNLEVGVYHDYFVAGILVHNKVINGGSVYIYGGQNVNPGNVFLGYTGSVAFGNVSVGSSSVAQLFNVGSSGQLTINTTGNLVTIGTGTFNIVKATGNGTIWSDGTTGTTPASGAGTRLMWIPAKAAFRAGAITTTQWDDASIGTNSVAMGHNTTASGTSSVALGDSSTASLTASFAAGYGTISNGNEATALGLFTTSSGGGSVAAGNNASANTANFVSSGNGSIAMGNETGSNTLTATGAGSVAIGQDVNATANNAMAFGNGFTNSTASSFNVGFGQADFKVASGAISFPNNATLNTGSGSITTTGVMGVGAAPVATTGLNLVKNSAVQNESIIGQNISVTQSGGSYHAQTDTTGIYVVASATQAITEAAQMVTGAHISATGAAVTAGGGPASRIKGLEVYVQGDLGLPADGVTSHYGADITVSGTAQNNYGMNIFSTDATTNYGIRTSASGSGEGTTNFGIYTSAGYGTTNWALYNDGGNMFMGADNALTIFGTGSDASMYYDGTNLIINPKVVGTGALSILGSMILLPIAADPGSPVEGQLYYNSAGHNLKLYNGGWVTVTTSSSLRYKHNVQPLADNWSTILQVQPKSFVYNGDAETATQIGYVAEDFDSLGLKDLVQYDSEGKPNGINYDRITLYDTEIIKQQQIDINNLKQRLGITTEAVTINQAGTAGEGGVTGVAISPFDQSIEASIAKLGATLSNGIISLKQVIADTLTVKTATVKYLQMQAANGDIYCTWIDDNGDWQKVKGNCDSIDTTSATAAIAPAPVVITPTTPTPETQSQPASPELNDQVSQQLNDLSQQLTQQQQATQQAAQQAAASAAAAARAAQQAAQQAAQANNTANDAQQQVQEQSQSQAINITSVAAMSDVNVAYGTDINSLDLLTTANVTLSDSTNQTVSVVWDGGTPTYDLNTPGTYIFSGTLTFSGSITNTDNLMASVNVTVGPQPAPAPTPGDLIQNAASSLLNGVWGFVKQIFSSGFNTVSSVSVVQKAGAGLSNASTELNTLATGLFEPILRLLGR